MKIVALTCVVVLGSALAASGQGDVWFGPMPFIGNRTLRDDFHPMLTDTVRWMDIAARADVFKSYIMILPDVPVPGNPEPELSDSDIGALIAVMDSLGLDVAFEVGGARSRDAGAGVAAARNEWTHLSRWVDLGGRIDYLSTDHSIAFALEAWLADNDPAVTGAMSLNDPEVRALMEDACRELAAYYEEMASLIPGVRFGAIESLGYWTVRGPGDTTYPATRPDLPELPFEEVFAMLVQAVSDRGMTLDHFHTDFGYEGVAFDGRHTGTLDYGRVMGVEGAVKAAGVRNGNIVNAFHDRSVPDPEPATASREAFDNTMAFFEGYIAAGNRPDAYVLQTWQPYPDRTGPETQPITVMYMHREVLTHDAYPTETGYVRIELAPGEAIEAGARWSVDGGATWHASGAVARAPKGEVSVTFHAPEGWEPPHPMELLLMDNNTYTAAAPAFTPSPTLPLGASGAALSAAVLAALASTFQQMRYGQ